MTFYVGILQYLSYACKPNSKLLTKLSLFTISDKIMLRKE